MNYLAHARLSFHIPHVLLGNMISDFVKGRQKFTYPQTVQAGIQLHRDIDQFTDTHPATKTAAAVLKPAYRLYSGAFVDVIYDHFLANDRTEFKDVTELMAFSQEVYDQLALQQQLFPIPFAGLFPYMRDQNWLYNYQTIAGITKSFGGLVRRARYLSSSSQAGELLQHHYQLFNDCYRIFWPAVKSFARQRFEELMHQPN